MKGKKNQLQGQIEIEAVVLEEMQECLYDSLEWLEVYIEKAGYYPDWQQRKQLPKTIERENVRFMGSNEVKGFFSTVLFSLSNFSKTSGVPFVLERLQAQFYSWLDRSGINVDNCPKELAECLVNVDNVLNGREEEFRKTRREEVRKNISQMTSEEQERKFYGAITELQKNLKNEEVEKAWLEAAKNKNPQDVRMKNKFAGNVEQGKNIFGQIRNRHSANFSSVNFDKVVENLKAGSKNYWRLDEIPTEKSNNFFNTVKKQEWLLIRWDADDNNFDGQGKLNFNNNPIYRWENFNSQQRFEIKIALNLSSDYLTQDEIKWVIKEVKDNPKIWDIRIFKGQECLTHTSAQGNDREVGTLIHNKQKFSDLEWVEIYEALERIKLVDKIKQHINRFEFQTVLTFSGQYWDNINKKWAKYGKEKQETMLVHKSVKITENDYNEHGYLNIKTDKMFQENRFNQEEWAEIQAALKINNIKRNSILERDLVVFNQETGEYYEKDDWFVHNQLKKTFDDKTGYLIYVPNGMIRAKDLTETEQKEVGYKVETSIQTQISRDNRPQGGNGGKGGLFGNPFVWGSGVVISLIGLAFTKK